MLDMIAIGFLFLLVFDLFVSPCLLGEFKLVLTVLKLLTNLFHCDFELFIFIECLFLIFIAFADLQQCTLFFRQLLVG